RASVSLDDLGNLSEVGRIQEERRANHQVPRSETGEWGEDGDLHGPLLLLAEPTTRTEGSTGGGRRWVSGAERLLRLVIPHPAVTSGTTTSPSSRITRQ